MGMSVARLLTNSIIPGGQFTTVSLVHTMTTYGTPMTLYSDFLALSEASDNLIRYYIQAVSMLGYITSRTSLRDSTDTIDGISQCL